MARRRNCVAEFLAASLVAQSACDRDEVARLEKELEDKLSSILGRSKIGLVVTEVEADRIIPEILAAYQEGMDFKIIPFKEIPFGLYDTTLIDYLRSGFSVGAGVKSRLIFSTVGDDQHIVKVVEASAEGVLLEDVDLPSGRRKISWDLFENAVLAANSGYWIVQRGGVKVENLGDKELEALTFNLYQEQAVSTAIYPSGSLEYLALGLNGESGEVAEIIKRKIRGDKPFGDAEVEKLKLELGDCLWYIANFANELGVKLEDIAEINVRKLKDRQARGVLHGRGDER